MAGYTLADNEFEIMRTGGVFLVEGDERRRLDELLLTNRNLVLVASRKRGLLGRESFFKRCSLALVQGAREGHPQVIVGKVKGDCPLRIVFQDETISLLFPGNSKAVAATWGRTMELACAGDLKGALAIAARPPEINALVGGVQAIVGSVASAASNATGQQAPLPAPETAFVTARCPGCHAPITGPKGSIVVCAWCGTAQTL